jgi:hypothetical protein
MAPAAVRYSDFGSPFPTDSPWSRFDAPYTQTWPSTATDRSRQFWQREDPLDTSPQHSRVSQYTKNEREAKWRDIPKYMYQGARNDSMASSLESSFHSPLDLSADSRYRSQRARPTWGQDPLDEGIWSAETSSSQTSSMPQSRQDYGTLYGQAQSKNLATVRLLARVIRSSLMAHVFRMTDSPG